ncbi:MAG TPA: hypothetical protein VIG31_02380, partial [Rhodanobacteraceae bacterium]
MNTNVLGAKLWIGLLVLGGGVFTVSAGYASSNAQPQMPRCNSRIGTLAVQEPQNGNQWWTSMNLESPAALIKVYVSQSGCFTLVDRGKGLQAA